MQKPVITLLILLTLLVGTVIVRRLEKSDRSAKYTIGILQTASHPALDATLNGFMTELKNQFGDQVDVVVQNAQGSVANAQAIAQQYHANSRFNAFFAIATPATQALSSVEKSRPIVIAAVTDPKALGLTDPNTNVCGVSDMIDVGMTVDMISKLTPNAKKIGLIYTNGETNSTTLAKQMNEILLAKGFATNDFTISNETDVAAVADLASRKSDLILAPTDNTVASTINIIAKIALQQQKPLIVSDNLLVQYGPLAARGVSYENCGRLAGQITIQILLENKKPSDIGFIQAESSKIFINQQTAAKLGLTIPESLHDQVAIIDNGAN